MTLGAPEDLAAIPDEIEPNPAVKQGQSAFPAIDRAGKGDPFIILRPGFDAHCAAPVPSSEDGGRDPIRGFAQPGRVADPARTSAASRPQPQFGDGATPAVPLDFALNSSTPTPSDGKVIVAAARPAAQTTVAAQAGVSGKPNYASLIDPKDSARQMRCLAEAIYFEARSEPEAGQAAVAQVVLNRVRSGIFPTNVCAVVYQDRNHPFACQFSFACEGKSLRIEEPGAVGDGDPHRAGGRQRRQIQSEGRRGAQLSRQLRLSVLGAARCAASTASARTSSTRCAPA